MDQEILKGLRAAIKSVEDYYDERGIFKVKFGFGKKPALIIIDMGYGWTDPAYSIGSARLEEAVAGIQRLLPICRAKSVPIIYTIPTREGERDPYQTRPPVTKHRKWDARAYEIDERIKPEPSDLLIVKPTSSAFFGTFLAPYLIRQGVDTLLVAGCSTTACVRTTATDAKAYGFKPIIPRQCVQDRAAAAHEWNLFDIDSKFGDVLDIEEVLDYVHRLDQA